MRCLIPCALLVLCSLSSAAELKLIPMPQQVEVMPGRHDLKLTLVSSAQGMPKLPAEQIMAELLKANLRPGTASQMTITLGDRPQMASQLKGLDLAALDDKGPEAYVLIVEPRRITVAGNGPAGTFYGVQTLRQLIRANRTGTTIPCVRILDWPGLRYRGYSDDISRGPIPTMDFFKRQIRTMAEFKMNMLTFYTEHVFKLKKHPKIAPEDGITTEQIAELSEYAKQYHVELVGNFQSFGHFWNILKHEEYANLRETPGIITPAKEESYQFLDEVYSEIAPAYNSPLFNVNCDETYGLGEGPSKELAAQIGVGGVYVKHMIRLHDMLKEKYNKRMMMWGDIALEHPTIVQQLPKDTILLSWGYGARDNYDSAIEPFVKAGFEFMVCPGVSCWSQIFPNYNNAMTNIQNYVRDGAKFGAIGVLNTTWDDDGENLFHWNFYGTNWGAACAWQPANSNLDDFNAAYAAVSYGNGNEDLTKAIKLLADCVKNPLTENNMDRAFWVRPYGALATTYEMVLRQADDLCKTTSEAIALLESAKKQTTADIEDLDYLLFAARRLNYLGRSRQVGLNAAKGYTEALAKYPDLKPSEQALEEASAGAAGLVKTITDLRAEYERLWLLENRPWWLPEMRGKYDALLKDLSAQSERIVAAKTQLTTAKEPPDAAALGLKVLETSRRDTRPMPTTQRLLPENAQWWDAAWPYRIPVKVEFGEKPVSDFPVEVAVNFGADKPEPGSIRVVEYLADGKLSVMPGQFIELPDKTTTVAFIAAGSCEAKSARTFAAYYDLAGTAAKPALEAQAITAKQEDGWITVESDRIRTVIGTQGAHVYEWFVKSLGDLEITEPGRGGYAGFCDGGQDDRDAQYDLTLEAAGPVLVRIKGTSKTGSNERTMTFFAGKPCVEIMLAKPLGFYWDYDSVENFAKDKAQPGTVLFSDGKTEPVCASNEQIHGVGPGTTWCAKTRPDGLLLAQLTPEVQAVHMTGPGGGWGGVGIEGSPPVAHFITCADKIEGDPAAYLNALQQTMDLRNQPKLMISAVEKRP